MPKCEHQNFSAEVDCNRITDEAGVVERYTADVRIRCAECGIPFRFLGLPAGLDLTGAATSANGEEARLSMAPRGEVMAVVDGAPMGYTIKRTV